MATENPEPNKEAAPAKETKWKTAISNSSDEKTRLSGYDHLELIGKVGYAETLYLAFRGEKPTPGQARVLNAMLVASIDHGIAVPSAQAARLVYSGNPDSSAALAAGLLALGEHHGGAGEPCARLLKEAVERKTPAGELVTKMKSEGKRIPGFGHKVYPVDPRTQKLLQIAKKEGVTGAHAAYALEVEAELERQSSTGKKLPLNIDGCIAALCLDLGFEPLAAKAVFEVGRAGGLAAHVLEEARREKPFRRLNEGEYAYDGPAERK